MGDRAGDVPDPLGQRVLAPAERLEGATRPHLRGADEPAARPADPDAEARIRAGCESGWAGTARAGEAGAHYERESGDWGGAERARRPAERVRG